MMLGGCWTSFINVFLGSLPYLLEYLQADIAKALGDFLNQLL